MTIRGLGLRRVWGRRGGFPLLRVHLPRGGGGDFGGEKEEAVGVGGCLGPGPVGRR